MLMKTQRTTGFHSFNAAILFSRLVLMSVWAYAPSFYNVFDWLLPSYCNHMNHMNETVDDGPLGPGNIALFRFEDTKMIHHVRGY